MNNNINDKTLVTHSKNLFELINKLKLDDDKKYLFPGIEICCSIPTIEAINEIFNFVNNDTILEIVKIVYILTMVKYKIKIKIFHHYILNLYFYPLNITT